MIDLFKFFLKSSHRPINFRIFRSKAQFDAILYKCVQVLEPLLGEVG